MPMDSDDRFLNYILAGGCGVSWGLWGYLHACMPVKTDQRQWPASGSGWRYTFIKAGL
jgi:hypothetical protein